MENNYEIMPNENSGLPACKFNFEWIDTKGKLHTVETEDVEEAQTIIGLLSGEICLGDLES